MSAMVCGTLSPTKIKTIANVYKQKIILEYDYKTGDEICYGNC